MSYIQSLNGTNNSEAEALALASQLELELMELNGLSGIKYKQKYVPKTKLINLPQKQLKEWIKQQYKERFQGKSIVNKHLGIEIKFTSNGLGKITANRRIGKLNASLVDILDKAIEYAEYNNFGQRKVSDKKNILGYLNFKVKVNIENKIHFFRISVKLKNDMTAYYNHSVYGLKKVKHNSFAMLH